MSVFRTHYNSCQVYHSSNQIVWKQGSSVHHDIATFVNTVGLSHPSCLDLIIQIQIFVLRRQNRFTIVRFYVYINPRMFQTASYISIVYYISINQYSYISIDQHWYLMQNACVCNLLMLYINKLQTQANIIVVDFKNKQFSEITKVILEKGLNV